MCVSATATKETQNKKKRNPKGSPSNKKGTNHPVKYPSKEEDFKCKFKTEVCRNFEAGTCSFGEQCAFAHGHDELQEKTHLAPNYKTKVCRKFTRFGFCNYGFRCQFIHLKPPQSSRSTSASSEFKEEASKFKRLPVFLELEERGKVSNQARCY